MGRKVLLAVLCWLSSSESFAAINNVAPYDNQGAESAPRLYRNVPTGVYASAAPYGAYPIHIPFIPPQQTAASRIIPVKENIIFENANGYFKDSYGNRFVGSPQAVAFKAPYPQQFVQLQELPAHFAQPLAAAPPSFQHKQAVPEVGIGSNYRLPLQHAAPTPNSQFGFTQPRVYAENARNLAPTSSQHSYGHGNPTPAFSGHTTAQVHGTPTVQHQSTINNAIFANTHPHDQYNNLRSEAKFQRLQEAPQQVSKNNEFHGPNQRVIQNDKSQLQAASKQTAITTVVNGKKTVIKLKTRPVLPLLDINLLEPLTFANPLVPQVQHFLPRINQATYHKLPAPGAKKIKKYKKEFIMQNTKSYDSGIINGKPKKSSPKKKQKKPQPENDDIYEHNELLEPVNPTITAEATPHDGPEISYEINSPKYKETYTEKSVSYNKKTESDPVHYSYGSKTQKAPVHYSYTRTSKDPVEIKEVHYQSNDGVPKQLIYNFDSKEQDKQEEEPHNSPPTQAEEAEESEESDQSEEEDPEYHGESEESEIPERHDAQDVEHQEHDEEAPNLNNQHIPEHQEEEYQHSPNQEAYYGDNENHNHNVHHNAPPTQYYTPQNEEQIHPVEQYEENIRLSAPIKVDPEQHLKNGHTGSQQQLHPSAAPQKQLHHSLARQQNVHPSPVPQQHRHISHAPHQQPHISQDPQVHHNAQQHSTPYREHHDTPPVHIQEKTKQIIIEEESPEMMHVIGEQLMQEMLNKAEDTEKDFEEAYQKAAVGFPAYNKAAKVEKDIYNPEIYGIPRAHSDYDIGHTPFQQYHEEGDEFPKTARLNYKDTKDKTKDDYLQDYSSSKPESMSDRHKNKENYFKFYEKQKPERYIQREDDNKDQKPNEKYTETPSYELQSELHLKPKIYFQQYKPAPVVYEYNYSKEKPRDNSAYASRPHQTYKSKTHFVEPQFQYGFEPVSIPRLLDSELAAMASNDSPESEKPGMRKKIYKENWYIKKTSTIAGPAS